MFWSTDRLHGSSRSSASPLTRLGPAGHKFSDPARKAGRRPRDDAGDRRLQFERRRTRFRASQSGPRSGSASILTSPLSLTPGTRLGVFELTALIGRGGMGEVYRATDTKLKRQVAIKILPPSFAARPRPARAVST